MRLLPKKYGSELAVGHHFIQKQGELVAKRVYLICLYLLEQQCEPPFIVELHDFVFSLNLGIHEQVGQRTDDWMQV